MAPPPSKSQLIEQLVAHFETELRSLSISAKAAATAATDDESRPENKYDTRGLEAAYLAGAQTARLSEVQEMMTQIRQLPVREFQPGDPIHPTALIQVLHDGRQIWFFLVTVGAGYSLSYGEQAALSISTSSPLGRALLNRSEGEMVSLKTQHGVMEYEILKVQ